MFCGSTQVGGSTRLVPSRRNLALRTWYAAAAERSRSIQPNVDLRVLTPSWWIERRQRYTSDTGCCGRCASVYRVCIAHALELVTNVIVSENLTSGGNNLVINKIKKIPSALGAPFSGEPGGDCLPPPGDCLPYLP